MSRNKRAVLEEADPFALSAATSDTSMQRVTNDLFGEIARDDYHRKHAIPVSIFDIEPHQQQPRRAIPHMVRRDVGTLDVTQMQPIFEIWRDHVARAGRTTPIDIRAFLDENVLPPDFENQQDRETTQVDGDEQYHHELEASFISLLQLAVSIRKDGLTNPITVVRVAGAGGKDRYQLETGERRWLAYHLLHTYTHDDRFSQISARIVDKIDVWRQASENNARANLNAISRARQLAVLLMDLLQQEGMTFSPYHAFTHEQGFYAQVADGTDKTLRIPRGAADKLLNAVGLKSKKQLREYRALLRLPPLLWQIADDLNWTERRMRTLRENAEYDDDRFYTSFMTEAEAAGYSVPMGTIWSGRTEAPGYIPRNPAAAADKTSTIGTPGYFQQFTRLMKHAGPGRVDETQAALERVQELRHWLDEQERQLKRYLKRS